jgi:AcrR family transcriptional regulator
MTDPTLKDRALDSVEQIVRDQGIYGLTLDAVAKSIGVSKGGLLHHFPTKDSLMHAVLCRTADTWRNAIDNAVCNEPEGSGRVARALIETFLVDPADWEPQCKRSSAAMMVLLIQNPKLQNPIQSIYLELIDKLVHDGLPSAMGDCILAVIDGIWLQGVTGLAPVNAARVRRIKKQLNQWIDEKINHAEPRRRSTSLTAARPKSRKAL